MNRAIFLVIFSIVIGLVGQSAIKAAMLRLGPLAFGSLSDIINSSWQVITQPLIWVALPLYGMGFIIWAVALSRLPLSFAYPLLSTSYIFIAIVALVFFDEAIPPSRWAGIGLIVLGIVLVGRS